MTTYNGENFLCQQLDSILSQTYTNLEIIICDDRSSDSTYKILQQYAAQDNRIKALLNDKNLGVIKNFEQALFLCSGEYIVLADQDDIWMPDKVAMMLKYLENADIVISDCQIIDDNGKLISPSFFEQNSSKLGLMSNLFKNSYIGCCMAFKRPLLTKVLPFPHDIPMHDWWIGLISEVYGKSAFCNQLLVAYRRHNKNVSVSGEKSHYGFFKKLHFRFIMIKNLIKRHFFNV